MNCLCIIPARSISPQITYTYIFYIYHIMILKSKCATYHITGKDFFWKNICEYICLFMKNSPVHTQSYLPIIFKQLILFTNIPLITISNNKKKSTLNICYFYIGIIFPLCNIATSMMLSENAFTYLRNIIA